MPIACATHFTESSFSAVKVAAALARASREPLLLINVQADLGLITPEAVGAKADARNALQLEAAALAADGVSVEAAIERGPLAPTLWNVCVAHKASFCVVGDTHHVTSSLFETPLDKFAHGASMPLLVVRDEKPLIAWADKTKPLKVWLTLDRSWTSALACHWVKHLAEFGAIDLTVCHLWNPAEEYVRRKLPPQPEHNQLATMIRGEVETALINMPDNVTHRVHIEIYTGPVAERLIELATEARADLFVIGTHPDHGVLARRWSVTHDVLGQAPMSVMCVPGTNAPPEKAKAKKMPALSELGISRT